MAKEPMKNGHKLHAAGFTCLRREDYPSPRIKVWVLSGLDGSWVTYEKDFPSKAARDRRMEKLKRDPKILVDLL